MFNLYPSHSETFYVLNGVFLHENEPVLLIFSGGGPQTPPTPSPHLPQCSDSVGKKEEIKGTNKKSHKKYL